MLTDPHPEFAPVTILGVLLAATCALVFVLLGGRRVTALFVLLPASALGVLLGQLVGDYLGTTTLLVGDLHVLESGIAAWLLLLIAKRVGL